MVGEGTEAFFFCPQRTKNQIHARQNSYNGPPFQSVHFFSPGFLGMSLKKVPGICGFKQVLQYTYVRLLYVCRNADGTRARVKPALT